jgi:3-O-methylgallate 3,4-dioxygenase
MAEFVFGFGSSHSLMKDPVYWLGRGENNGAIRFMQGRGIDPVVLGEPRAELDERLTMEYAEMQFQECNAAIKALGDALEKASVDTIIVVTNLHGTPPDDFQTIFGMYLGDEIPVGRVPRREGNERPGYGKLPNWATTVHPADPALARHVYHSLILDGFDVAHMKRYGEGKGIDHEHTVLYDDYLRKETPMVPFQLSRYLPNQATSARCYALGRALRGAIDSWDANRRVAIMASGGLSHQIVDEELDREVIDAMRAKDREVLSSLPRDRLNSMAGTAEILNWVTVCAAAEDKQMTLLAYVPSYWSNYSMGHGFTFAYWQ